MPSPAVSNCRVTVPRLRTSHSAIIIFAFINLQKSFRNSFGKPVKVKNERKSYWANFMTFLRALWLSED